MASDSESLNRNNEFGTVVEVATTRISPPSAEGDGDDEKSDNVIKRCAIDFACIFENPANDTTGKASTKFTVYKVNLQKMTKMSPQEIEKYKWPEG